MKSRTSDVEAGNGRLGVHRGELGRLEDLIPIAVVIAAGCEPCSQRMVERALNQGCPAAGVERALRIVASMQKRECVTQAVGPAVTARMQAPLMRAWETLSKDLQAGRHKDEYEVRV